MIQRTNLAHGELDKSFAQILSALKSVSASLIEIQNGISAQYLSQSKTLTDGQGELTNVTSALSAQIQEPKCLLWAGLRAKFQVRRMLTPLKLTLALRD